MKASRVVLEVENEREARKLQALKMIIIDENTILSGLKEVTDKAKMEKRKVDEEINNKQEKIKLLNSEIKKIEMDVVNMKIDKDKLNEKNSSELEIVLKLIQSERSKVAALYEEYNSMSEQINRIKQSVKIVENEFVQGKKLFDDIFSEFKEMEKKKKLLEEEVKSISMQKNIEGEKLRVMSKEVDEKNNFLLILKEDILKVAADCEKLKKIEFSDQIKESSVFLDGENVRYVQLDQRKSVSGDGGRGSEKPTVGKFETGCMKGGGKADVKVMAGKEERARERSRERAKEREKSRERAKERAREKVMEAERDRWRSKELQRELDKNKDKERNRDKDRDLNRGRDGNRGRHEGIHRDSVVAVMVTQEGTQRGSKETVREGVEEMEEELVNEHVGKGGEEGVEESKEGSGSGSGIGRGQKQTVKLAREGSQSYSGGIDQTSTLHTDNLTDNTVNIPHTNILPMPIIKCTEDVSLKNKILNLKMQSRAVLRSEERRVGKEC